MSEITNVVARFKDNNNTVTHEFNSIRYFRSRMR